MCWGVMYCTYDFSAGQLAILINNSVDFTGKREKKRIFPGITENLPSHMYGSKRRKARVLIDKLH